MLHRDSTVELVAKGKKRMHDKYSSTPLLSPTVKKRADGNYEIGDGVDGCDRFWVIILPEGNIHKDQTRHPVYSFNVSSLSTMAEWSEWVSPDYESTGASHWSLFDSGECRDRLPIQRGWPLVRYRMVIRDISHGFPGTIINSKPNDNQ